MFSFIMAAAYTGSLISFMTYPGKENPINTAEEILESGYDIEIRHYGGMETVSFEATQNPSYQKIWTSRTSVDSPGLSMEKVIKGKSIYVDFFGTLVPSVQTAYSSKVGKEMVHIGKNSFFSFLGGWAYQTDGIINEVMDREILLFISFGFTQHWLDQSIAELKKFSEAMALEDEAKNQFAKLTLANLQVGKLTAELTIEN